MATLREKKRKERDEEWKLLFSKTKQKESDATYKEVK